jgi:nucleotide-binding universal stress UspA family protein
MSTDPQATTEPAGTGHRIVVGVDGSEDAERALEWAAAQADRTGSVLDIQTAYEPGYTFITHDEVERTMERRVDEAAAYVAKVAPRVVTKSATHEEGPAAALIEASEGADLLVVGSRGLGGFAGLLLGSVGLQCSLHAHCPVTIIR